MMITSLLPTCRFLIRNLWCARRLRPFQTARLGPYLIEPLDGAQRDAAIRLYRQLNPDGRLAPSQRFLLRCLGPRLCLVARDARQGGPVALTLFYFNARDRGENTVHAAYNGLLPAARGAGLGTFMLRHALAHFAAAGLAGASSRVTLDNHAALKVNEKAGFFPLETYFDPLLGAARHYLVCDLRTASSSEPQPKERP